MTIRPPAALALVLALLCSRPAACASASFTRLVPLDPPRVVAAAQEYPGGSYSAAHLVDGKVRTEYATDGAGTDTFVELSFGRPVALAALRYTDRKDPATVAASRISLRDADGEERESFPIRHVNRPGATTLLVLPHPVEASSARWQVTELGGHHTTVGGAELVFYEAGASEPRPSGIEVTARAVPWIERRSDGSVQPVDVTLDYPYARPADVTLRVEGQAPRSLPLRFGSHTLRYELPASEKSRELRIRLEHQERPLLATRTVLEPARRRTIYLLPHSHTDIGYTQIQTEIEDKQVANLLSGMEIARRTADYPEGARFVWNVEVLWAADLYLRRLDSAHRSRFLEAVERGDIELCGMYLNELTGLCRPEELMRLFRFGASLRRETGVPIESAMISDVPGYTWGTVSAMAEAGIRYFSVAPNYFDRMGDILVEWENKPFYWVGPSEEDRVLVWIPYRGYATSHIYRALSREFVEHYQRQLEDSGYPYEVAYLRWAGHGDNATPDPSICDFVRDWNERYEWPRFIISGPTAAFRALEERHGDELPVVRGDWTPYWEDGAGSSAVETAMNRASSDRLIQAEALWSMLSPGTYATDDFEAAWRSVLLYSEHTWGAWCSVSQPTRRETLEQWRIKRSYALAADLRSSGLLSRALALRAPTTEERQIDVFNTTSWERTDLVVVPKHLCEGCSRVLDAGGSPLPSQRLLSGELAFLARSVPPLCARRYTLARGPAHVEGKVAVSGTSLSNGELTVRLDETTGGIVELRRRGLDRDLVDSAAGHHLNDYLYFRGADATRLEAIGPVRIAVRERGPLVASLRVDSPAPGCHGLRREVLLVAGLDRVEIRNLVDKKRLVASSYHAAEGKESLSFTFPFGVPDGQVRVQVPYGVLRPDVDQIPSACKNWFTVGRWADVSSHEIGVTWVTLDTPLVQVGGLTANLLNSQTDPDVWRKRVGPTQRLDAWAMNNHWGTNYRAYQEGPVTYRFVLWPHGVLDPAAASRVAIGSSQPLLAAGARGEVPPGGPLLTVSPPNVLVTGLKPSDDGQALIVRLWEAAGEASSATIERPGRERTDAWRSDLTERAGERVAGEIRLAPWEVLTLRLEP